LDKPCGIKGAGSQNIESAGVIFLLFLFQRTMPAEIRVSGFGMGVKENVRY
jgi:hypothetical protein